MPDLSFTLKTAEKRIKRFNKDARPDILHMQQIAEEKTHSQQGDSRNTAKSDSDYLKPRVNDEGNQVVLDSGNTANLDGDFARNTLETNLTGDLTKPANSLTKTENDLAALRLSKKEEPLSKDSRITTKLENDYLLEDSLDNQSFNHDSSILSTPENDLVGKTSNYLDENHQTYDSRITTKTESDIHLSASYKKRTKKTKDGRNSTKPNYDLVILGACLTQTELEKLPNYIKNQFIINTLGILEHVSHGYLQRTHVFRVLRIILSPSEFVLYDYFYDSAWDGDGNGITRQSLSRLSERTSLGLTAIKDSLKSLDKRKLIKCIEKNMKTGNLYQVANADLVNISLPESDLVGIRPSWNPANTKPDYGQPGSRNPTICKELHGKQLLINNSLSEFLKPTQLSALQTRWMSFMKKEREREEKGLLKLFQEKPDEAELILKAFGLILKEQDEHGQIKSAISVLETNYTGQYRDKALAAIARKQERENQASTVAKEQTKKASEEDAQAKVHLIRTQCFEKAFPDLAIRKQYILNICKDNPMFIQLGEGSPIATGYAIMQWANGEGSPSVLEALEKETATSES